MRGNRRAAFKKALLGAGEGMYSAVESVYCFCRTPEIDSLLERHPYLLENCVQAKDPDSTGLVSLTFPAVGAHGVIK